MNLKIHIKKVKGRYYMSLGCKGYKSNHNLNAALEKWIKKDEGIITFTDTQTTDSVYRAEVVKKSDCWDLNLYDLQTNELVVSQEQCPKILEDYDICSDFYINYNSEWK